MVDLHVVLGATGATGRQVVAELLRRGHRVRAVHRSGNGRFPDGVEVVAGDAGDAARMIEVCAGAKAVHGCFLPAFDRWMEEFPAALRGCIAGAGAAGAILTFADDTWMYGRVTAAMTESTPVAPCSNRGALRAWFAEILLGAHSRGEVRMVIARAGELYGPGVTSLLDGRIFRPAAAGRTVLYVGDPDVALTPTFVGDFARTLVTLGEQDDESAFGRVWHVPHPMQTTAREFIGEIGRQCGTTPRIVPVPVGAVRPLGLVSPLVRQGAEILYQFTMPFVVNGMAFATSFGEQPTTYTEGIAATLANMARDMRDPRAAPTGA
jgi:nucleoside-diphosphate-sugar epimerase